MYEINCLEKLPALVQELLIAEFIRFRLKRRGRPPGPMDIKNNLEGYIYGPLQERWCFKVELLDARAKTYLVTRLANPPVVVLVEKERVP